MRIYYENLPVVNGDFTIPDSGYRNNTRKGKIPEALMIKRQRKINRIKTF